MFAALDTEVFVDAAFRFLLALVPGLFASISLKGKHRVASLWRSSLGHRADIEALDIGFKNHPGYALGIANPGIKIVPTRGVLPPEPGLFETDLYRLLMKPFGWRHAVALCFYEPERRTVEGLICVLSVHRSAQQGDYTDAELARLESVHSIIDRALHRVQKLEKTNRTLDALVNLLRPLPLPALVLGWDLRLLFHTSAADGACAIWRHGPAAARLLKTDRCEVPEEIIEKCREMREKWEAKPQAVRAGHRNHRALVRHPSDPDLQVSISLNSVEPTAVARPCFLVQWDLPRNAAGRRRPPSAASTLAHLARLSSREREVARLVCRGLSNHQIAEELGRSLSTIKKQLATSFKKLGVPSRAKLQALFR
jgi:DNA-binding CsgD family transcriptional regulator